MPIDISPVVNAGILLAMAAVSAYGVPLLRKAGEKAGIDLSVAKQQALQQALDKACQAGAVAMESEAAQKGWDHIDVRNGATSVALSYLVQRFPDTLKLAGVEDVNAPGALASLRQAIQRTLPTAMAPIAASPATTNGPPAAAA